MKLKFNGDESSVLGLLPAFQEKNVMSASISTDCNPTLLNFCFLHFQLFVFRFKPLGRSMLIHYRTANRKEESECTHLGMLSTTPLFVGRVLVLSFSTVLLFFCWRLCSNCLKTDKIGEDTVFFHTRKDY